MLAGLLSMVFRLLFSASKRPTIVTGEAEALRHSDLCWKVQHVSSPIVPPQEIFEGWDTQKQRAGFVSTILGFLIFPINENGINAQINVGCVFILGYLCL